MTIGGFRDFSVNGARTALKSPRILGRVLDKYLNYTFPLKVPKFLCKSLNFLQL